MDLVRRQLEASTTSALETTTTSMIELIDRRDLDDPGTATTSMIELIDRRDLDDPGTAATSKIELIDRQDLDDPGTRTTLAAVDLIVRQDPSVLETRMTSMRTRSTDH